MAVTLVALQATSSWPSIGVRSLSTTCRRPHRQRLGHGGSQLLAQALQRLAGGETSSRPRPAAATLAAFRR
jgi:hypothetical protein